MSGHCAPAWAVWGHTRLWAAVAWLFAASLSRPALAEVDVLGGGPSSTKVDLILHDRNTDFSAYRLDCEVFGWNKKFTEVAAVGVETTRGPHGKHRGEAYLLVYRLGEAVPIYNVIAHNITHADLPHDPIPIDDARDLTWVIENSYLDMWPHRPRRKHAKGLMHVEVLWDPRVTGGDLCTPAVGFVLRQGAQVRYQPFLPLDLKVRCNNLKHTDSRIYWGKRDVAAAMVRFDFSASPTNERSARFVVSAAWEMARPLRIVVREEAALPPAERASILKTLRRLGTVQVMRESSGGAHAATLGVRSVEATAAHPDLLRYVARSLQAARRSVLTSSITSVAYGFPDLLVTLGSLPPPLPQGQDTTSDPGRAAAPGAATPTPVFGARLPSRPGAAPMPPPRSPGSDEAAGPGERGTARPQGSTAAPRYIDAWEAR